MKKINKYLLVFTLLVASFNTTISESILESQDDVKAKSVGSDIGVPLVSTDTNEEPSINVTSPKARSTRSSVNLTELQLGADFDPLEGVTAIDKEDGDISDRLVVTDGEVDTSVAGFYHLTYQVTDNDLNTVTMIRNILVNDGTYSVGSSFVIQAENFTKRKSEVDASDEAVKDEANVVVFDRTGLVVSEEVSVDKGGYTNVAGEYNITFTVTSDITTKITVVGEVTSSNPPVITAPEFTEINLKGSFNAKTGVTASDDEDGDLTANIKVKGIVYTGKAGFYTITYTVVDSDGNEATAKQQVLVNDGSYVVGTDLIIYANDFSVRVSEVDTSDDAIRQEAVAIVYDKNGNALDEEVTIEKGGYTNVVGDYNIKFTVTSDTSANITKVGTVTAGEKPEIEAPELTEISLGASFDIMSGVSATDAEDGDLTSSIVVAGSVNAAVKGFYPITYEVTDSDGNKVTATQLVVVNDGGYVVGDNFIIEAEDFTKLLSLVDASAAGIKADAKVVVYDKTGSQVDVVVNIDKGGYTNVLGVYNISFTVNSDAKATKSVVGTVISGGNPVLLAPTFTEVNLGDSFDVMSGVSATDVEDGILTNSIVVNGDVDTSTPGFYQVAYEVEDSDGNKATAERTVLVNDGTLTVGLNFIIKAEDFTRRVSQVDTSDAAVKDAAKVEVYDKKGNVVNEAVTVVNKGGYTNVAGDYNITFRVTSDLTAVKTVVGTVATDEAPKLNAPEFTEINLGDSFNAMAGVSATDAEDGDLTSSIVVSGTVDTSAPGFYKVTYEVEDLDGNKATAEQEVLVNDGTFTVGSNFVIRAQDFTRLVSEVDTSDQAIKDAATVEVYDKKGNVISEAVSIINNGGYKAVKGTYDITFAVSSDLLATKSVVGTVNSGDTPDIVVPAFTELNLGDSFDAMTGVSATDVEDGDLTSSVVVSGTVDTSAKGFYEVTYTVEDSDGNEVTEKQTVLVNDGTYVVGTNFVIQADDFTRYISEVDTSEAAITLASNVVVYDKTGTAVSEAVKVVNKGGYTNVAAEYNITLAVTSDPTATKTVVATVISGEDPEITTPTYTEIDFGSTFDPMTEVSATDAEDGDLTSSVVVSGSVDTSKAGFYTVTYTVEDSDGNTATAVQNVLVNDGDYVSGDKFVIYAEDFTKRTGEVDASDAGIKEASKVVVYDKTGTVVSEAVTVVNNGSYTNKIGTYDITLAVASDATATKTIEATVISGDDPIIIAPSFTEINLGDSFTAMDGVSATDAEDGNLTNKVAVVGVVNTDEPGHTTIVYSVEDSDGNKATVEQTVLVNDGNYIVGDNYTLHAEDFTRLVSGVNTSDSSVKSAAKVEVYDKSGNVVNEAVSIDKGTYTNVEGNYDITFTVTSDTTATKTIVATVEKGDDPGIGFPSFLRSGRDVKTSTHYREIEFGVEFDPMEGVTAYDPEDGDITDKMTVTGSVDVNVAGFYLLVYSVTDSDLNTVVINCTVLVNDGTYKSGSDYVIKANDFTKKVSEVNTDETAILAEANVVAYDLEGNQVSDQISVNIKDFQAAAGSYAIEFSLGNTTRTITATVVSGEAPVLETPGFIEIQLGDELDLMEGVSANDVEDGDLTGAISLVGRVDNSIAGFQQVTYSVTDSDNNTVSVVRTILVNDGTYIVGANYTLYAEDFTKSVSEVVVTHEAIIADANVQVYANDTGLSTMNVVDIVECSPQGYAKQVGEYQIHFTVSNDSAETTKMAYVVADNQSSTTHVATGLTTSAVSFLGLSMILLVARRLKELKK